MQKVNALFNIALYIYYVEFHYIVNINLVSLIVMNLQLLPNSAAPLALQSFIETETQL